MVWSEGSSRGAGSTDVSQAGEDVVEVLHSQRINDSSTAADFQISADAFSKKSSCIYSGYFDVAGFSCRLLVYPAGDTQAVKGYVSIYLQVDKPGTHKWDVFASYKLSVVNVQESKTSSRDSWHRFSSKKKSHGWADFASLSSILHEPSGFIKDGRITVRAECLVLAEESIFTPDPPNSEEVLVGKFNWKVHNFGLFLDMIKSQKIMSPAWSAGNLSLRLSVYQSIVNNDSYLSMCLESKDSDKNQNGERTCWTLFRMSVLPVNPTPTGAKPTFRDSYGRFAAKADKTGENTSLGWNDFMPMSQFTDPANGYLVGRTAQFSASFHIIKESYTFRSGPERPLRGNRPNAVKPKLTGPAGEIFQGKFTWKIEHFKRDLKENLKKKKITGLCIKSKRFQVGGRDCRLIVYPRGQSQPPNHLSMFLEVTDPRSAGDWSCFVSHRLAVVNKNEEKTVTKESQNRYSRQAKDWGWREFITLTSLFDQDAGFIVNDTLTFAADVVVLKEATHVEEVDYDDPRDGSLDNAEQVDDPYPPMQYPVTVPSTKIRFTWRIENFSTFCDILQHRKIFSKFFNVKQCDLRVGMYESYQQLCVYLESETPSTSSSVAADKGDARALPAPERNYYVDYCVAVLNQRHPDRTQWKAYKLYTRAWNNSVLQLGRVDLITDAESGHVVKDTLVLQVEVLDCQPCNSEYGTGAGFEGATDDEDGSATDDGDSLSDGSEYQNSSRTEDERTFNDFIQMVAAQSSISGGMDMGGYVPGPPMASSWAPSVDASASMNAVIQSLRQFFADPVKVAEMLRPSPKSVPGSSLLDMLISIPGFQVPVRIVLLETVYNLIQSPLPNPMGQESTRETGDMDQANAGTHLVPPGAALSAFSGMPGMESVTPAVTFPQSAVVPPPGRTKQQRMGSGAGHPRERPERDREGREAPEMRGKRLLIRGPDEGDDAECVSSSGPSGDQVHSGDSSAPDVQKVSALRGHSTAMEHGNLQPSATFPASAGEVLPGSGARGLLPMARAQRGRDESPSDDDCSGNEAERLRAIRQRQREEVSFAALVAETEAEADAVSAAQYSTDATELEPSELLRFGASQSIEGLSLGLEQLDIRATLAPGLYAGHGTRHGTHHSLIGEAPTAGMGLGGLAITELLSRPARGLPGLDDPNAGPPVGEYGYPGLGPGTWFQNLGTFGQEPAVPYERDQLVAVLLEWITSHSGKDDNNLLATGPGSIDVFPSYPMQDLIKALIKGLQPDHAASIAAIVPHLPVTGESHLVAEVLLNHLKATLQDREALDVYYRLHCAILEALLKMVEDEAVAEVFMQHAPRVADLATEQRSLVVRILMKISSLYPVLDNRNMRVSRNLVDASRPTKWKVEVMGDFRLQLLDPRHAEDFLSDVENSIQEAAGRGGHTWSASPAGDGNDLVPEGCPVISFSDVDALFFLLPGEFKPRVKKLFATATQYGFVDIKEVERVIDSRHNAMALEERDIAGGLPAPVLGSSRVANPAAAIVGLGADDFEPLLALTAHLFSEPNHRSIEFAEGLYSCLYSTFPDTSKREMIVRSLLKSNGVSMPTPGQTKGKKEDSKTLDKARLLASASSLARVLQQMMAADLTAGASSEGTSKQSGVFNCLTEAFRCCLDAMELKKREGQGMRNRLQEMEVMVDKVQKEYQASLNAARAEAGTLEGKVKRLEKEAASNRATHQAELQDLRTTLKKAQDEKVSLENQLESARQQASNEARKAGELAASVKDWRNKHAELDAQLTRLKAARNKDVADLKAAKQTSDSLRQALDKARTEKEAKDGQLAKAREEAKKALADLQTSQGSLACAEREAKEYKAATMALKARLKEINLKEQQLSEEVKELRACLSAKEAGPASTTTLERPVRELVDAAVADGTSSDHQEETSPERLVEDIGLSEAADSQVPSPGSVGVPKSSAESRLVATPAVEDGNWVGQLPTTVDASSSPSLPIGGMTSTSEPAATSFAEYPKLFSEQLRVGIDWQVLKGQPPDAGSAQMSRSQSLASIRLQQGWRGDEGSVTDMKPPLSPPPARVHTVSDLVNPRGMVMVDSVARPDTPQLKQETVQLGPEKAGAEEAAADLAKELAEGVLTSGQSEEQAYPRRPVIAQEGVSNVRSAQDLSRKPEAYPVRGAPSVPNLAAMGSGPPVSPHAPGHLQPMAAAPVGTRLAVQFPGGLGRPYFPFGRGTGAAYTGTGLDRLDNGLGPVNMGRSGALLSDQILPPTNLDLGAQPLSARPIALAPRQPGRAPPATGARQQPGQAFEAVSGFSTNHSFSVAPPRATGRSPSFAAVDYLSTAGQSGYYQQQAQQLQQLQRGLHPQSLTGSQHPPQQAHPLNGPPPGSLPPQLPTFGLGQPEHGRLNRHQRGRPPDP